MTKESTEQLLKKMREVARLAIEDEQISYKEFEELEAGLRSGFESLMGGAFAGFKLPARAPGIWLDPDSYTPGSYMAAWLAAKHGIHPDDLRSPQPLLRAMYLFLKDKTRNFQDTAPLAVAIPPTAPVPVARQGRVTFLELASGASVLSRFTQEFEAPLESRRDLVVVSGERDGMPVNGDTHPEDLFHAFNFAGLRERLVPNFESQAPLGSPLLREAYVSFEPERQSACHLPVRRCTYLDSQGELHEFNHDANHPQLADICRQISEIERRILGVEPDERAEVAVGSTTATW